MVDLLVSRVKPLKYVGHTRHPNQLVAPFWVPYHNLEKTQQLLHCTPPGHWPTHILQGLACSLVCDRNGENMMDMKHYTGLQPSAGHGDYKVYQRRKHARVLFVRANELVNQ